MKESISNHRFFLNLAQQDIYFDQLKYPQNPLYNVGGYIRMATIDVEKINRAHQQLINSEAIFSLSVSGNEQSFQTETCLELPLIDCSSHSMPEQAANEFLTDIFQSPLDFEQAQLYRAYLIKLSEDSYWYVGLAHHLAMDGWGFANWAGRLAELYHTELSESNIDDRLTDSAKQWQLNAQKDQEYLAGSKYQRDKSYWSEQSLLDGEKTFNPRYLHLQPKAQPLASKRHLVDLPVAQSKHINQLAKAWGVSAVHIYLAALTVYIGKVQDKSKLVFGLPAHNRKNHQQKQMLGAFVTVSPLAVAIDDQANFVDLVLQISKSQSRQYRHQKFPIGHLIHQLNLTDEQSLYDIGFNYIQLDSNLSFEQQPADLVYFSHNHEQTPLMVNAWAYGSEQQVQLQFDYNLAYFTEQDVAVIAAGVCHVLAQVSESEQLPLSAISLVPNLASTAYSIKDSIVQGIEQAMPVNDNTRFRLHRYLSHHLLLASNPANTQIETSLYADYFHWQRLAQSANAEVYLRDLDYWRQQIEQLSPVHGLSLDFTRSAFKSNKMAVESVTLDNSLTAKLTAIASHFAVSLSVLLQSALALMLSRHSNSADIAIGTEVVNVATNHTGEVEALLNRLLLRINCDFADFAEYLQQVSQVNADAMSHRHLPFELLLEQLSYERSANHAPLSQILFNFVDNQALTCGFEPNSDFDLDFRARIIETEAETEIDGQRLQIDCGYDASLFTQSHIEQLCQHLAQLLQSIAERNGAQAISMQSLSLLSIEQTKLLVDELNRPPMGEQVIPERYCGLTRLHQLIEQQAQLTPERIAVEYLPVDGQVVQLSYAELNTKANRLAHWLIEYLSANGNDAGNGPLVGISVERSVDAIVGLLAIIKAGAAYLPIDSQYPLSRVQYMCEDSGIKVLLTQQTMLTKFDQLFGNELNCVAMDDNTHAFNHYSEHNPNIVAENDRLYLIYTSGSTGQPKGVSISHANALNLLMWYQGFYQFNACSKTLIVSSLAFDLTQKSLFVPLICGGVVSLVAAGPFDPHNIRQSIVQVKPTHLNCAPSAIYAITDGDGMTLVQNSSIEWLLLGGEAVDEGWFERFCQTSADKKPRVSNMYGPTEGTDIASQFELTEQYWQQHGCLPIGRVNDNVKLYLLDRQFALVPHGCVGELFIAGRGVGGGYLNKAELTAAKFVDDPYGQPGDKMYRTGDLARYLPDNNLMFMGRIDDQIKFRGFRIEPGEIVHQLLSVDEVITAKVLLRKDKVSAEKAVERLVAYIEKCPNSALADAELISQLQHQLQQKLADYMVPSAFVVMDTWPLTANGKIDKRALPIPEYSDDDSDYVAPSNAIEQQLVTIWAQVLQLDESSLSTKANFFTLGGHSLLAVQLIGQVRAEFNQDIAIKVLFDYPTIITFAQYLASIISSSSTDERPMIAVTKKARQDNEMPLASFAQQRLWLIDQMQGSSAEYNMPAALTISGDFNIDAAQLAFSRIISRHQSLRTVFQAVEGQVLQDIRSTFDFTITRYDLTQLDAKAQQRELTQLITQDRLKAFDLSQDLMMRVSVVSLSQHQVMLFNMHHIASDGWSMNVLLKEFAEQYRAAIATQPDPLPALSLHYADYADWQRQWLQHPNVSSQLNYWAEHLADIPQVHSLPLDHSRQISKDTPAKAALVTQTFDQALAQQLQQFASDNQLTLFMLLHGTLALMLSRHSNSQDIVIGTPVANRVQQELEDLIGFFVNTLVLRVDTNCDDLSDYLQQVKQVNLAALANQDVPFEQLVERLNVERSSLYNPLFQIMLTMDPSASHQLQIDDVTLTPMVLDEVVAKFDLDITVQVSEQGIAVNWLYDSGIFTADRIESFTQHFANLLQGMLKATSTAKSLKTLPMLTAQQSHYLTHSLNQTQVEFAANDKLAVHDLISRQAKLTPHRVAVIDNDQQLSYQQLEQQANDLAYQLIDRGVKTGDVVGHCLERSSNAIVAILAILKAGAAYVPLDSDYPQARLAHLVSDSGLSIVLTQSWLKPKLAAMAVDCICIDQASTVDTTANTLPQVSLSDAMYVIYTSGSTGKPKGAKVNHGNANNLLLWYRDEYQFNSGSKTLIISSLAFDLTQKNLFVPLLSGGAVALAPSGHFDPSVCRNMITEYQISHINCAPSAMYGLTDDGAIWPEIDWVLLGGEPIEPNWVNKWVSFAGNKPRLINMYGPTECTDIACAFELTADYWQTHGCVPIGRANANVELYVLDHNQQLLPFGAVGELCIGGKGVGDGYLNQAEQNQQKFIANPFTGEHKLYRTGDLVRYLPDGNVLFVSRIDDQIKFRGFRIELGEIEYHLANLEAIESCVVMLRHDNPNQPRLVGYIEVSEGAEISQAQVFEHMRQCVADFMVPSAFVFIDAWPLTPNGKTDKKALPAPDDHDLGDYVAPNNPVEQSLSEIWAELLSLDSSQLSVTADFFALGGHSLLVVKMTSLIRARLYCEVAIKTVFDKPTISALAAHIIDSEKLTTARLIMPVERAPQQLMPLSYAQQRLWFIDHMQKGSAEYNMSASVRIDGDFDVDCCERAFARIIARHESLRTVFVLDGEQPMQTVREQFDFAITKVDLSDLTELEQQQQLLALVEKDSLTAFDLTADLMLRASVVSMSGYQVLLFNMHHIASDGWSIGVLFREFVSHYHQLIEGKADILPELSLQYIDYAHWQRNWLTGEVLTKQLDYWQQQLDGVPAVHSLPLCGDCGPTRPEYKGHSGGVVRHQLGIELTEQVLDLAKRHQLTPFMLLHGALALVLSRHSNNADMVIGTAVANRIQAELEPLIGFFVNTLVLRVNTLHPTLTEYLAHVKAVNLDAQSHQDIGFEQLVEHCKVPRNTAYTPLVQILFTMDTNERGGLNIADTEFTPLDLQPAIAKFDLDISAEMSAEGFSFNWIYDTEVFSQQMVETFAQHLQQLLHNMVCMPNTELVALPMGAAWEQGYHSNNQLATQAFELERAPLIHQWFEQQAFNHPNDTSLIFKDQHWSFRQINQAANQLAHYLVGEGIRGEDDHNQPKVAILLERSEQMIIAILAVLKTGSVYVPIDPVYPKSRQQQIIKDCRAVCVLTEQALYDRVDEVKQLVVDSVDLSIYPQNDLALSESLTAKCGAYILFTSGSTGRPKGVLQTHLTVSNLVQTTISEAQLGEGRLKQLLFTTVCFDVSIQEITTGWRTASPMVLISQSEKDALDQLPRFIAKHQIERISIPPAVLDVLLTQAELDQIELNCLKQILVAGDAVRITGAMVSFFGQNPDCQLWNHYGPTETHTVTAQHIWPIQLNTVVSIGRAVENTRLYILDEQMQAVAAGQTGQLYVAGAGLAQGYCYQPQLTAERFIDIDIDGSQQRVYRTGDLVRLLPQGNLDFIGRCDDQLKIRGFRVEPGEIEYQLAKHPQVDSCVVKAVDSALQQLALAAYVLPVANSTDDSELVAGLKSHLQAALPDYMVPASITLMQQWPLNHNGKIDKRALPQPSELLQSEQGDYVAAQNELEQTLVDIWAQLLKLSPQHISTHANFFELGGHSLLAVRLMAQIRSKLDCELPVREIFDHCSIKQLAARIEQSINTPTRPKISRSDDEITQGVVTSFAQQRIWFIDQLQNGSVQYNLPFAVSVAGDFDLTVAEQALQLIIERHEVLRTVYVNRNDEAIQQVLPQFDFTIEQHDLTALTQSEQTEQLAQLTHANAHYPFDLTADLMVRAAFVHLDAAPDRLLFNLHHIAADGWSIGILYREFIAAYQAIKQQQSVDLPALDIRYVDYAKWQRQWLNGDVLDAQLDYWRQQLAQVPPVHQLPLDFARTANASEQAQLVSTQLPPSVATRLQDIAVALGLTPFMLLQGAFALLVARHSNSNDIVVGTPVANRLQAELEPLMGCFVNTLVLRTNTEHHLLADYFAHVRNINLAAQAHQDIPFEQLVEHCQVERNMTHAPLFQLLFTMNTVEQQRVELPGVSFTPVTDEVPAVKFDLELTADINDEGLCFDWLYDGRLFKAATIETLAERLNQWLKSLAVLTDEELTQSALTDVEMLNSAEQLALKSDYSSALMAEMPAIHQVFEAQVAACPDDIAVVFDDGQPQRLSYLELNQAANRVARLLLSLGVEHQDLVGICLDRSTDMLVTMLAVLKVGAAYVPLDPEQPQARRQAIIDDTQLKLLVDSALLAQNNQLDSTDLKRDVTPNDLAYVTYTSGSTGKPKGVMIEHQALSHFMAAMIERIGLTPQHKWLAVTTITFDIAALELFAPLLVGAQVVMTNKPQSIDGQALIELIAKHDINVMQATPATWQQFLTLNWHGKLDMTLLTGGEALPLNLAKYLLQCCHTLLNCYGPTEATIWSMVSHVTLDAIADDQVYLSDSLANYEHVVMDPSCQLTPLGSVGELCIGGISLARGYFERPDLDQQQFVMNDGKRWYRTGDLVRPLTGGRLAFMGRADNQVKIRGFRVEPDEIAHQLQALELVEKQVASKVESAVVTTTLDTLGHHQLVAYVSFSDSSQSKNAHLIETIRQQLTELLPSYMVPAYFVEIAVWPTTANGKIDKKALPQPQLTHKATDDFASASDEIEQALVAIWAELLALENSQISVNSNFFELGGHSLLAVRLTSEVKAKLKAQLVLADVFEYPSIRQLATHLRENSGESGSHSDVGITARAANLVHLPLSFAQQRLWFIDQLQGQSAEYNMPLVLTVEGELDLSAVNQALTQIVARHEILRTVYLEIDKQPMQSVNPTSEVAVTVTDLTHLSGEAQQSQSRQMMLAFRNAPFDLTADLMLRASFIGLAPKRGVLMFNMHHIASDGWSIDVLSQEFFAYYQAFTADTAANLAPLAIQYGDFALWQSSQEQNFASQIDYWQQQLADIAPLHGLVTDKPRPEYKQSNAGLIEAQLATDVAVKLSQRAKTLNITPFMLVHGALSLMLSRHSNSGDIVIGTPVANRLQPELAPLIGFFVNTLVLRSNTDFASISDFYQHIRDVNVAAQQHQDVPFERLVDGLNIGRNTAYTPLFQILLTTDSGFSQASTQAIECQGVTLTPLIETEKLSLKFDLELSVNFDDTGVSLNWLYDNALFTAERVAGFNRHLCNLLHALADADHDDISALTMLDEAEYQRLTLMPQPNHQRGLVHQQFEYLAQIQPDHIALIGTQGQMSYRELNQKANQLARYLRHSAQVESGQWVGVSFNACFDLIVSVLAILKLGAAYVPLDPKYPASRLSHMINDSGLAQILTQQQFASLFCDEPSVNAIALDVVDYRAFGCEKGGQISLDNLTDVEIDADSPAYLIYTSGSTGQPKGVMIAHQQWYSLLGALNEAYQLSTQDRVLQFSSISFDIFVEELSTSILNGSSLVLIDSLAVPSCSDFWQSTKDHQISIALLPTAYWHQLCEDKSLGQDCIASPLRLLSMGGEAMQAVQLETWQQQVPSDIRVLNVYGPTETTVIVTHFDATEYDISQGSVPLGSCNNNSNLLILDEKRQPVPDFAIGELYIGGAGVGLGYWQQIALTEARFIANPFTPDHSQRLYQTGDKVYRKLNGDLVYVGRDDAQVKISGFRVELGEVEHLIGQLDKVDSVVVMAKATSAGSKQLVAFVKGQFDMTELKPQLAQKLPHYMVPSVVVAVTQWPLTPNGKVDKAALESLQLAAEQVESIEYVPAQSPIEQSLQRIWAELLQLAPEQISIYSNFFDLGGHSLLAVRLVSEIRAELGLELPLMAVFDAGNIAALASMLTDLQSENESERLVRPTINQRDASSLELPLSFAQQRLWFINQLQGPSSEYNMPIVLSVDGQINLEAVSLSLNTLVKRHEILRTIYCDGEQGPIQKVCEPKWVDLTVFDLTSLRAVEKPQRCFELVIEQSEKPFDLTKDLMLRASYIRLDSTAGVLMFNMHHIASDGWSLELMRREFFSCFSAYVAGSEPQLAEPHLQYADFALWQREYLQGAVLAKQLDFWAQQLEDVPTVHSLPLDKPRPNHKQFKGANFAHQLPATLAQQLTQLAKSLQLTPFMLLHGALALVLARHSNNHDVVIGTPVANRLQSELDSMLGLFVNTLVLRVDTNHASVNDYFAHVAKVHVAAQNHQELPFEQLLDLLDVTRSTAHNPLFQIMLTTNTDFALQSELKAQSSMSGMSEMTEVAGVYFTPFKHSQAAGNDANSGVSAKFDLNIHIDINDDGVKLLWNYDAALFERASIERFNRHLCSVLEQLVTVSTTIDTADLADIDMLSEKERHYLLHELNHTEFDYQQLPVHQQFELQVAKTPDAVALVIDGQQFSFAQINQRANRIAAMLRANNTTRNDLVGICMARSSNSLISQLAVLKTGAAFVPFDIHAPKARVDFMLHDTQLEMMLCDCAASVRFDFSGVKHCLALDSSEMIEQLAEPSSVFLDENAVDNSFAKRQSTDLAYIIYTSGSTGKPKGVMVEQRNLTSFVPVFNQQLQALALDAPIRFLSNAAFAFDASLKNLMILAGGHQLVMLPESQVKDAQAIIKVIEQAEVNVYNAVPQMLYELLPALAERQLKPALISSGDAIDAQTFTALKHYSAVHQVNCINAYGPTETTINSTFGLIAPDASVASIGRPVANTQCYIVNSDGQLQPQGCEGELWIAGSGVARGYLNREAQTAEQFITNPFTNSVTNDGTKVYKTGDLVRYTTDGSIEFIGRIDHQVKIRGMRIELGEIENGLLAIEGISQAVVRAKQIADSMQLVAYVITEQQLSFEQIKSQLGLELPAYMVPNHIVELEQLPLLTSGKVDFNALPLPQFSATFGQNRSHYKAPSTATEQQLVLIWSELLKLESSQISIDANFFELGGHSLLTVRLLSKIRSEFATELPLMQVFDNATVYQLANMIDSKTVSGQVRPQITSIEHQLGQAVASSFAQQRLWFIDQMSGGSSQYNLPLALDVTGDFEPELAEQAIAMIIERHQVLRTVYLSEQGQTLQRVLTEFEFKLDRFDLTDLTAEHQRQQLAQLTGDNALHCFDLSADLMVRGAYIALSGDVDRLLLNIHHIAADGWSMGIFYQEFVACYQALRIGTCASLANLAISYIDYALWQRDWLSGEVLNAQLGYWQQQLAQLPTVHHLPLDNVRTEFKGTQGAVYHAKLDKAVADKIERLAIALNVTPFMLLQGAFALVLSRHSNSHDIVVGTPVANRMQAELEPLIGFFVNTLVLRTNTEYAQLGDYFDHVRQVNLAAQAHQDIPFEQLVEHCQVERSSAHTPLFQIMFSMNTVEQQAVNLEGIKLTPVVSDTIAAKFDLELSADINQQGIRFDWLYDSQLFEQATVERLAQHLNAWLLSLVEIEKLQLSNQQLTQQKLTDIEMLSDVERAPLFADYSCYDPSSKANDADISLIHRAFEAQAAKTPNEIAISYRSEADGGDEQLSYFDLNARANQLAWHLIELNQQAQKQALVGVCLERGVDLLVALLAVLKSGCGYVPLDPHQPQMRRDDIVNQTQMALLIDDEFMAKFLSGKSYVNHNPEIAIDSDDLAYVTFTSGSTGQPKGVMIEHSALSHFMTSMLERIEIDRAKWLAVTTITFDIAALELFGPLLCGGQVVMTSSMAAMDANRLIALMQDDDIDVMQATPATWQLLQSADWLGKQNITLLSGGEALPLKLAQFLVTRCDKLFNCYGPTEATIWSMVNQVTTDAIADGTVYLADSLSGYRHIVCNSQGQLTPIGAIGELYIGGNSLARGYFNRDDLTAKQFIELDGLRWYRSGDLVMPLTAGRLAFVGRADNQVKVRGFRIEPDEVRAQIETLEGVETAVVTAIDEPSNNGGGNKQLVAYIQSTQGIALEIAWLRDTLGARLPAYMVPSHFVMMTQWPLTANGKIDKKALPAPDSTSHREYVAPNTPSEMEMSLIWSQLLNCDIEQLSVESNFFELGGHSLLVAQLVQEVNQQFGLNLTINQIFQMQTIRQLALHVDYLQALQHSDTACPSSEQGEDESEEELEW